MSILCFVLLLILKLLWSVILLWIRNDLGSEAQETIYLCLWLNYFIVIHLALLIHLCFFRIDLWCLINCYWILFLWFWSWRSPRNVLTLIFHFHCFVSCICVALRIRSHTIRLIDDFLLHRTCRIVGIWIMIRFRYIRRRMIQWILELHWKQFGLLLHRLFSSNLRYFALTAYLAHFL